MSKKLQKWFMHVDMDAFYASIEQKDHPELRGKPVIVGGGGSRGVVSAASYEIRKFGVHSAMPIAQALQLCPHAILVPVRMARYAEVSRTVIDVLRSYSPRVEKASVDEAYLDATGLERLFGPVEDMARRIKREVKEVTGGLTCSIGLAPVKFLAKIASDLTNLMGSASFTQINCPPSFSRFQWNKYRVWEKQLLPLPFQKPSDLIIKEFSSPLTVFRRI